MTSSQDENYRLAKIGTWRAIRDLRHAGLPYSPQDSEDMLQCAWLAVWSKADGEYNSDEHRERYLIRAARDAAMKHYTRHIVRGGTGGMWHSGVCFIAFGSTDLKAEACPRRELTAEQSVRLRDLLLNARKVHTEKTRLNVDIEARIAGMLYGGASVWGIATELELTYSQVRSRRAELRKYMRRFVDVS